jgi:hypothetical protein
MPDAFVLAASAAQEVVPSLIPYVVCFSRLGFGPEASQEGSSGVK